MEKRGFSQNSKKKSILLEKNEKNNEKQLKVSELRSNSIKMPPIRKSIENTKLKKKLTGIYEANFPPILSAITWSIFNFHTGKMIFSKLPYEHKEVGSITKLMAIYTCHLLSNEFNLDFHKTIINVNRISKSI